MKVGTDGVLLGAWAYGGQRILDIGTGTGIIALMMAQRYREALVKAIDIDEGAAIQARQNAFASPFADRVEVYKMSLQELTDKETAAYNAIVCNPPFFVDALSAAEPQRNAARHTVSLSYQDLMSHTFRLLDDAGELSVIVPFDYRRRMDDAAVMQGFFPSRCCAVSTKVGKQPKRFLLAFRKRPCPTEHTTLTIGSADYDNLVHDFYLDKS